MSELVDKPAPAMGLPPHRGTWALSFTGILTVIKLELRQRVRSTRWILMLVIFFGVNLVFCGLTLGFAGITEDSGMYLFGVVAFIVFTLALLVSPALSSTSINGDRAAGVLAVLQVTLLSPAEIAVGKMLAAWVTACVFLATSVPFLLLAMLPGGTSIARLLVTVLMMMLILLAMCGIGLGWSAVTARTVTSVVMTYLTLAFLCLGSLLLFGLSLSFVHVEQTITVQENPPNVDPTGSYNSLPRSECVTVQRVEEVTHTEYVAWLLYLNPYVTVADAAPRGHGKPSDGDLFTWIGQGVRVAAAGPPEVQDRCYAAVDYSYDDDFNRDVPLAWAWPPGLLVQIGLAGAGVFAAVRRLRTPAAKLARGTRIA